MQKTEAKHTFFSKWRDSKPREAQNGVNGLTRQNGGKRNCDVNEAKANRNCLTAGGYSKLVSDLAHQTVQKKESAAGFPTRAASPV